MAVLAEDEMFVVTCCGFDGLLVYPRTAGGNVTPLRAVSGPATGLRTPYGVAVDAVNSEVIVTDYYPGSNNPVSVFGLTANGDAAPVRKLFGPATELFLPVGVAVDTVNDELIIADRGNHQISVFARTANGNAAPLRKIVGGATGLSGPEGVAIDLVNNELLVVNGAGSITVYGRTANGNVAPLRTVTGPATGLTFPRGLAVDQLNNELVVTNYSKNSVSVFARTANGDAPPLRTISGVVAGLNSPFGVAVDTVNNELVVANIPGFVSVFPRTASGNVAPMRSISGPATRLATVIGVAITSGGTPPVATAATVVEFYNAALDHYFITWIAGEIAILDAGVTIKGWVRTGQSFKAYVTAQGGASPVCRYYIPPELGDSHFFGRGTDECNATGQNNTSFILEDPQFMQMFLPVLGVCPANTIQIYRVFSNRPDANHRYLTDKAMRDQMVIKNWLAEGDGPDLVVMCAPQ